MKESRAFVQRTFVQVSRVQCRLKNNNNIELFRRTFTEMLNEKKKNYVDE